MIFAVVVVVVVAVVVVVVWYGTLGRFGHTTPPTHKPKHTHTHY